MRRVTLRHHAVPSNTHADAHVNHGHTLAPVTRLEKKIKDMLSQRSEVLAYEIPYTHTHWYLYWNKCSYTQRVLWETRMKQDKILHRCVPCCNFEGNQAVLSGEQRSRKDLHPNRSSGGVSGSCPQTRRKNSLVPSPKSWRTVTQLLWSPALQQECSVW